ncbi:phosphate butyryltransferase [Sporosarcina sp. Te-1]|uniref:phosphate butyryltransferase n=1 Tax=Sporosarcina sp. Te-1 TaxID=2818390 RepID=UPI001A9E3DF9|nr:phosphate butyryltransferase [Sporosarcina sp. Te-1]QTD41739.1 phosphate butyryltransferase [Sporosarcina sp. Te-1]
MASLDSLIEQAAALENRPVVAVASAADSHVLGAVKMALERKLAAFRLFGEAKEIRTLLASVDSHLLDHPSIEIVDATDQRQAAQLAVQTVSSGEADVLMKGNLPTATILKEVLNRDYGLRKETILSHVAAFEVPGYEPLLFVTDAAMNIAPDLMEKAQIVRNAVQAAHACGIEKPIVAPLAAVETVNPAMQPTLDAAALVAMNHRGQISGCFIDGPLALDNAVSQEAAEHKGIAGETAGKADILIVPTIEAGNILYKSLMYFAKAKVGAVIQGAKAPVVLTSRSDHMESKLYSLALAILVSKN